MIPLPYKTFTIVLPLFLPWYFYSYRVIFKFMNNKSDTYKTVRLPLKEIRKRKKVSQTNLAKALKISQSQVSKWEINGEVPVDRVDDINNALDVDPYLQDDLNLCGDIETIKSWKNFFRAYARSEWELAEDDNPYLEEFNEHPGLTTFLGPLVDAGFSLPPPPIYKGDEITDLEEGGVLVEYSDKGTKYFFDGDLSPFSHFWSYHANFRRAFDAIHCANEIDHDGYFSLPERDICSYVWYQVFKALPFEKYPLPECEDFIQRFPTRFMYTLQAEARDFEARVHSAWLDAYRSNDSLVRKPTWMPAEFLLQAGGEIDFGERVVFSEFHSLRELSPDPYVRQLQEQIMRIERLLVEKLGD